MPGVSDIEAGRAFLKLFVEDEDFKRGLDASVRQLESYAKSLRSIGARIGGIGAAMTAPFVAALKIFADVGSALSDMKARTGLTVESLSELKFAAEQTGTSLDTVEKAARKMQDDGIDPNKIFEYAASVAAIEDPVKRAQVAMELWGKKTGAALLPMLQDLPELRNKARELGLVWSDGMARSADDLGDALDILKTQFVSVAAAIAKAVAPAVTSMMTKFSYFTKLTIDFISENRTLVTVVGILGVALTAVAVALVAVGTAAVAASHAIAGLKLTMDLLAKHPYAIIATIGITALLAVLGPVIDKFLGLNDATADLTNTSAGLASANERLAESEKAVADAIKKTDAAVKDGTDAIDVRSAAINKMLEQRKQLEQSTAIDNEIARIKEQNLALEERYRLQDEGKGPALGAYQPPPEQTQLARTLRLASMFGWGALFPLGIGGGAISDDPTRNRIRPALLDGGRNGFDSPEQVLDQLNRTFGPRGTFSGRMASQIFGAGSDGLTPHVKKLTTVQERALRHLDEINNNTRRLQSLGPIRVGLA